MSSESSVPRFPILTLLALTALQLACGLERAGRQSATVEALADSLAKTATAETEGVSSEDALRTAEAQATRDTGAAAATQTAQANLTEEQLAATATAFAPYLAELPDYDVDPTRGRAGWVHPPITLQLEGYQQQDSENQFIGTVVDDFVLSADITWNTQYGTSGCGFVLRTDGNEEAPNQYMLIATRAGLGHVIFSTMANGEFIDSKDFFAGGLDSKFEWRNDTTNRLTVVGRGLDFTIYTNGKEIGTLRAGEPPAQPIFPTPPPAPTGVANPADIAAYNEALEKHEAEVEQMRANFRARRRAYETYNTEFERGFVTMVAFSESGQTTCRFDNAWLWLIE